MGRGAYRTASGATDANAALARELNVGLLGVALQALISRISAVEADKARRGDVEMARREVADISERLRFTERGMATLEKRTGEDFQRASHAAAALAERLDKAEYTVKNLLRATEEIQRQVSGLTEKSDAPVLALRDDLNRRIGELAERQEEQERHSNTSIERLERRKAEVGASARVQRRMAGRAHGGAVASCEALDFLGGL